MALESIDIRNKEFSSSWRGLNRREVHQFLEQVADRVEELKRNIEDLKRTTETLRKERDHLRENEQQVKQLVQTARDISDQIEENAREEAERIKQEARDRAEDIVSEAEAEAERIRESNATLKAKRRKARQELLTLAEELKSLATARESSERELQTDGEG